MINLDALAREDDERRKAIAGFRAFDYTGEKCKNCGRVRVMNCANGRHVCEKCHWDEDLGGYAPDYPVRD